MRQQEEKGLACWWASLRTKARGPLIKFPRAEWSLTVSRTFHRDLVSVTTRKPQLLVSVHESVLLPLVQAP